MTYAKALNLFHKMPLDDQDTVVQISDTLYQQGLSQMQAFINAVEEIKGLDNAANI